MFTDSGHMRICTAKSVLKKLLQSDVSVTNIENYMHSKLWFSCSLCNQLASQWKTEGLCRQYDRPLKKNVRDVYLVFDRFKAYSTKYVTAK